MNNFTESQEEAYNRLVSGKNLFLTGAAGTGKSYIIAQFRDFCAKSNITVGVTSSTGVSALLIDGTTIHSFTGIALGLEDAEVIAQRLLKSKFYKWRYICLKVLIIDEISMISGELFTKLDSIFKKVRENELPFGGVQLVITGDFLQLPPVNTKSKEYDFAFNSPSWKQCFPGKSNNMVLHENVRQFSDVVFQKILTEVRIGSVSDSTFEELEKRINVNVSKNGISPTQLFGKRSDVDKINQESLRKLLSGGVDKEKFTSSTRVTYVSASQNQSARKRKIPKALHDRLISKLVKTCPASTDLVLCVGAQVMLLHNLDIKRQLVNGSRGIVISFESVLDEDQKEIGRLPKVRFISGVEETIALHSWTMKEECANSQTLQQQKKDYHIASYTQIPLGLAYATTIHKSQGGTLDCASMQLNDMFEYGQLYTALSRVKSLECLSITSIDRKGIKAHPDVLRFYSTLL